MHYYFNLSLTAWVEQGIYYMALLETSESFIILRRQINWQTPRHKICINLFAGDNSIDQLKDKKCPANPGEIMLILCLKWS